MLLPQVPVSARFIEFNPPAKSVEKWRCTPRSTPDARPGGAIDARSSRPSRTHRALVRKQTPGDARRPWGRGLLAACMRLFGPSAHAPAGVWAQGRAHGVRTAVRHPCAPRRAAIRHGAPSRRLGSLGLAVCKRLQGALAQEVLGSARRPRTPWADQLRGCHAPARRCARAQAPRVVPALLRAPAPRSHAAGVGAALAAVCC